MRNPKDTILIYTFIWIGLILSGCIDEISLDLDSGKPKVVVFGWITNVAEPYEVSIKLSNDFNSLDPFPEVNGAEVFVTTELGDRYDFIENGLSGLYYSDPSKFVGQPSQKYQLHILIDEKSYLSRVEVMPKLSPIEEAFIGFLADPNEFEVKPEDENYFVSAFIEDDLNNTNYYRWKISVDDMLRNQSTDLVLFDDQFTNGNTFKFDASNVLFTEGQKPTLTHMSLSKSAFDYYKLLKNQSDASTFSPRTQPSVLLGNMINVNDSSELVLGFFGASEITEIQIIL